MQPQHQGSDGEHRSDRLCLVIPPGLWADVFLHLVVPCGFPSQVEQAVTPPRSAQHADCHGQMWLRHHHCAWRHTDFCFKTEKPVTQVINMSDIWLVCGGIPLSSAADFCCFKLQTAGVAMVFLKWVLSQCFLCLGQSPGQPDLGEGIELNWVEVGETVLETRVTATPTIYSADSLLQARPLRLSLDPGEALSQIWVVPWV